MSARIYAQTIGAGETIRLPNGRYFYIKTASAALNLKASGNTASPATFDNIGAGTKFGPVAEGQGWRFLDVTSASAQNVEIAISDDGNFEIASAVTVSGSVQTVDTPASAMADTANVALPNATTTAIVAANLTRKRVTIGNPSTAAGSFFIRTAGGANNLLEVQPGMYVELRGTYAVSGRNDSGGALSAMVLEES